MAATSLPHPRGSFGVHGDDLASYRLDADELRARFSPTPTATTSQRRQTLKTRARPASAQGGGELDVDVVRILEGEDGDAGVGQLVDLAVLDPGIGQR